MTRAIELEPAAYEARGDTVVDTMDPTHDGRAENAREADDGAGAKNGHGWQGAEKVLSGRTMVKSSR